MSVDAAGYDETRSCEDFPEVANLTDSEIELEAER